MALVALLEEEENCPQRIFRDRGHPLEVLNDREVVKRYRLPRFLIFDLLEQINESIQRPTLRGHAIPPLIQVVYFFTVLYFSYKAKFL